MHFVNAWNFAELNVPPPNPPVAIATPHFLKAAVVLALLKVFGVPVKALGERVEFGVGRAVPVRGAGMVTPFFTRQALWAVVRFANRPPRPLAPTAGNFVIFGFALAVTFADAFGVGFGVVLAATLGFVVALVAAFEAGIAPNMATAIDSETRETARTLE